MQTILDFFSDTFLNEFQTTMTGDRIASGLIVAFFLALWIIFIYKTTYQGVSFQWSYCFSLTLIALVTSVVIMTVTTNLSLSLGMVGALSIVRFRTAVKDPADTVFLFWSITVGIMAGAGLIYIAFITNIALGCLYLAFYYLTKKILSAPYMLIISYQKDAADSVEDALKSLRKMRVRSRIVKNSVVELCVSAALKPEELKKVDLIGEIEGVVSASAVSYQADTVL